MNQVNYTNNRVPFFANETKSIQANQASLNTFFERGAIAAMGGFGF